MPHAMYNFEATHLGSINTRKYALSYMSWNECRIRKEYTDYTRVSAADFYFASHWAKKDKKNQLTQYSYSYT